MQPIDPSQPPSEELPPLVLRPGEIQLPPLVLRAPIEYFPAVLAVPPKPPHPGFWMACVWSLVFLLLINVMALRIALLAFTWQLASDRDAWQRLVGDIRINPQALQESMLFANAMAWGMGVAEAISVLFGLVIVRNLIGRDWKRELGLVRPRLVHVVLVILAAPVMMALGDAAYDLARRFLPTMNAAESTMKMAAQWPWWFSVLVIGIGPGFGEELWCRGFLGRGLVGRYGFVAGVVLTAFLFGLLHVDPPHVVAAFAMGLLLHYVYLTTRCLWMSMLLHFLNNAIGAVLTNNDVVQWLPALEKLDEKLQGTVPFFAAVGFLVLAVIWALYVTRTRLVQADGGPPFWKPPYPGAAAPPEGSGTVEVIPRLAWLAVVPALVGAGGVAAEICRQLNQ